MYQSLLADANLISQEFLKIDRNIAHYVQKQGCILCGQKLHVANFPRKVRTGPFNFGTEHDIRFSFCCSHCRKRHTPPSVRFLGRSIYSSVLVFSFIILKFKQKLTFFSISQKLGPDPHTLRRWLHRLNDLGQTTVGKLLRARFITKDSFTACLYNFLATKKNNDTVSNRLRGLCIALSNLSASSPLFDAYSLPAEVAL